jgi:flagellar hook-associated protein 2
VAGSVIDVNSLVSQLVAAERKPLDTQVTRKESKATVQISALANLKGGLAAFQKALTPLKTTAAFSPKTAKSGNEDVFTASATASAATGTYDIEVVALAKNHQLASKAFVGGDTAVVGTGTLTISQAGVPFNVVIDSSNNTLAGIRDAINDSADNTGVQATIVRESGGSRLVLTSSKTGAANAIQVSTVGDVGLDDLKTASLTELQPAQDAHIKISTFDHYSTTNTVEDAIDGVTLDLSASSEGETVSLNVTRDSTTLMSNVNAFVKAYNNLATQMGQLRSYTPDTQAAGPLLGDAMLRGIEEQLRQDLGGQVTGTGDVYNSLAAIGITKLANGQLELDSTKFQKALDADSNAVAQIFGGTNGIAKKVYDHIESMLSTGAPLDTRNTSLQKQIKDIATEKTKINDRMTLVQQRMMKQFTALDTLLSSLQTQSEALTQQLGNLPGAYSGA